MVAEQLEQCRELALSESWIVIRPITIQQSPPHCERLSRPPHCRNEGVTGESGPLIVFSAGSIGYRIISCRS